MLILCIAILIVAISLSKKRYGTYVNHITVFLGVNIGAIILMYGCSNIDSNLSFELCIKIIVMFVAFLIGSIIGQARFSVGGRSLLARDQKVSNISRLRNCIIIYSVIYDIFAIYYLYSLNSYYGLRQMFINMSGLNVAIQNGDFQVGISSWFMPIGFALSLMILFYCRKKKGNLLLYIQYALCYIQCISPRRDNLFFMIAMTLMFMLIQSAGTISVSDSLKRRIKRIALAIVIIVAAVWVMSYTQNLMNKSVSAEFTVFGFRVPDFLKDAFLYVGGNYSYAESLQQSGQLQLVYPLISTLRLFYRYLGDFIGLHIDTTVPFALSFYNIGSTSASYSFNSAPILYYAIIEMGNAFFVFFIIAGFISRKAFNAVREKNSIGKMMLGLFQFDILLFSFRSYNLIYLNYFLALVYIFIVYLYVDVSESTDNKEVGYL